VLKPLPLTRIVTTIQALDSADFAADALVMRTAPDEALVISEHDFAPDIITTADPHAIVVSDSGWWGAWMAKEDARRFLRSNSSWELPPEGGFAQGRVADAAAKLWVESDRVLFVVPHVAAHDFSLRMKS